MSKRYTAERNTLMLIYLMKKHGIRKVIASPGTTNISFVGSIQQDPYFEVFSAVDERSAAYIACGLAAECGEPVALSCTGATASRNYIPGLTEAFYRKLPVLAITSSQYVGRAGHYVPQFIDRSAVLKDMVNLSVSIPNIHDAEEEWFCNIELNRALLELRHNGGGPVHINLTTTYSKDFSVDILPEFNVINRYEYNSNLPKLVEGKIGVFVGAHVRWTKRLTDLVEEFCCKYNAVVFCDHTSNYHGKYRVDLALICAQEHYIAECRKLDVLIHIGYISGTYTGFFPKEVWRLNPDGEIRDTFKKLTKVFEMEEETFFEKYNAEKNQNSVLTYFEEWKAEIDRAYENMEELPFSNIWIAKNTISKLPEESCIYLGILNTLRSWNYFVLPNNITVYSNTGGFGIDGGLSTTLGIGLANQDKLVFSVLGDLSFFYDMNALGNRHFPSNIRIMIINNGRGMEFRNYNHPASEFEHDADKFMAAAGHFGNKSVELVCDYANDLGFKYISAKNKAEYLDNMKIFISENIIEKPIVFEVFTDMEHENEALRSMNSLLMSDTEKTKQFVKKLIGEEKIRNAKRLFGKN